MSPSKMKVVAVCVTILAVLSGCSGKQQAAGGRTGQAQRAVPVEVKKVNNEDFAMGVTLSGRLEASQRVDVNPKASGRIQQILVKIGDQVKAGQPLITLEGEELNIQLQRSEAAYMAAKAKYNASTEGTPAETIAQTQNSLTDAQRKADAAKTDLDRTQKLFKEGAVSTADVEKAKLAYNSAVTALDNMVQKLKEDKKGPTQSSLDSAAAALKQAEADYALAKYNYGNRTITAPIDGIVGNLPVSIGNTVGTNTVVAQIVNLQSMKVNAQVSETQVGLLHNDQAVEVKIPAINTTVKGTISSVSPIADSSKMYPVEIAVNNADLRAKDGMVASLDIAGQKRKAMVVPREAVMMKEQKYFVYVVDGEKAKQVTIQAGDSDGKQMEVLSGLTEGQEVVVKGQNTLADGTAVVVIDPNQPEKSTEKEKSGKKGQQGASGNGESQGWKKG
ncbi:efflux RND transporter periplasmic adaptor subunit [Brevibacillus fluminis]|uniref:efflux RND transporter periplasmic adaptor subunit n=1 Tax=Brevibacillus fluminis TaxID=511487 RepID=UPI003F89DF1E